MQFTIEIVATHIGDPKRFTVYPVLVVLLDENDNYPKIVSPFSSTIEILLPDSLNASITRIIAKDEDKECNALLQYSIHTSTENLFSVCVIFQLTCM